MESPAMRLVSSVMLGGEPVVSQTSDRRSHHLASSFNPIKSAARTNKLSPLRIRPLSTLCVAMCLLSIVQLWVDRLEANLSVWRQQSRWPQTPDVVVSPNLSEPNAAAAGIEAFAIDQTEMSFDRQALQTLPTDRFCRPDAVRRLNVISFAHNQIKYLESNAFVCVASSLKILILDYNQIETISYESFSHLDRLQVLSLSNNRLSEIPPADVWKPLKSLRHLDLSLNRIESISSEAFSDQMSNLNSLNLNGNPLTQIDPNAFVHLSRLRKLSMSELQLNGTLRGFRGLSELRVLHLDRGRDGIKPLTDDFCLNSRHLDSLVLRSNRLAQVPKFSHCQNLLLLDLSYNQIGAQLLDDQFVGQASLIDLYLGYNQIETIHEQAFVGLKNLQVLELNNNRLISIHKRAFAPLRFSLQHLNLAHNSHLNQVPSSGLDRLVIFKSHGNPRLRSLPYFRSARSLTFTFAYHCCEYCVSNGRHSTNDDSDNLSARPNGFGPLIWLRDLLAWILSGPEVSDSETPDELDQRPSRVPLSEIIVWPAPPRVVDASSGDSLGTATADKTMIESPTQPKNGPDRSKETATLNRKRRRISQLPVSNLIDELIWEIVATRRVHSVGDERWDDALSSNDHNNHNQSEINMSSVGLKTQEYFNIYLDTHLSAAHESRPKYSEMKISEYISKQMRFKSRDAHGLGPRARRQFEQHIEAQLNPIEGQHLASPVASVYSSSRLQPNTVDCKPQPSPFQPCRDLFDSWPLRFCIWFVFMFAFVGNILVIVVLVSSRQSSSTSALTSIMWLAHSKRHIDVPRFLVINLAVADLLMAVYLGILAIVDLSTLGNFRLYAIKWQYSNGCKLAGFLAVLSSELSVFILAIITLERNYAITNAVHLNRRLSLQKAMIIMIIGYMFAISMALMPLNGISDYGKHSICLPIDFSSSSWARAYVITILTMNTLGFLLLLGCYLRMYCAIRGSQAWNANDLKIAKRMSILVLTDFLCWMPIITVSVASLFGHYLVGIDGVKIMVIFVLPLNSVANPFLYAITTKRFKRDLNSLLSKFWSIMSFHACKSDFELPSNFNQDNFLIACNNNQRDARIGNRKTKSQTDLATKIKSSDLPYLRSHRSRKTAPHTATLNKPTSCGSTKQQVQIRTQDNFVCESIISSKPKIVLDCECHRRSSFDSGDENDIKSLVMPDKTLHSDCESKPMSQILPAEICDIEGRSLLSLVRLGSGAEIHRAHSIRSSIILKSSGSSGTSEILCAKNSKAAPRSSVNYSHHSHNRRRQNLVDDNSQLLLVDHKQHIVDRDNTLANSAASINEIRCKSATQHNRTHKQSCGVKFCSEDPISSKSERNRSPLARRILLSPIARAWSSLQISLSGKKSHSGCSLLQTDPNQTSTVIEEPKEPMLEDSKTHREHHILDDRVMVDEFLLLGATSEQYRGNERRMSRSCETINIQQSPRRVGKAKGASQLVEPTVSTGTTTTTTGSQYEYDDRRILLATINQLARNRERLTNEPELMGNPSRSTRCRSWSPALLGKLEDCISQIRNKLPRLGSSNLKSQHIQRAEMDAISSDESLSSESDVLEKEIVILSSEEEDKFSDNFINMSEHMRLNRNHKNRSLQQQSSITSDSSRITTKSSATFETGTATTNLASSLSELSSNIPLVPGNSRNNYDIYESVRENR